jgi:hypothetical protein
METLDFVWAGDEVTLALSPRGTAALHLWYHFAAASVLDGC